MSKDYSIWTTCNVKYTSKDCPKCTPASTAPDTQYKHGKTLISKDDTKKKPIENWCFACTSAENLRINAAKKQKYKQTRNCSAGPDDKEQTNTPPVALP